MGKPVPKAQQLYKGDINKAIEDVQKETGVAIDPSWWVASGLSELQETEQILRTFDEKYAPYLKSKKPEYQ